MAERPKGYGMTAELKEKKDAKYDPELEAQARDWMERVVGEPFPSGTFEEALHDGVYLCKLINKIKPGSVKKYNTSQDGLQDDGEHRTLPERLRGVRD